MKTPTAGSPYRLPNGTSIRCLAVAPQHQAADPMMARIAGMVLHNIKIKAEAGATHTANEVALKPGRD
jgi:hypothetical protein